METTKATLTTITSLEDPSPLESQVPLVNQGVVAAVNENDESAAIPTTITSLDGTTQECSQEEVQTLESDQTPPVDGGEVGGRGGKLNKEDAYKLPKYVIIQTKANDRYLHLYNENAEVPNALRFNGDYSFNVDTKFEVVPATTGTGLIHIRSLQNYKYWASFSTVDYNWIAAMAEKPEEDQSNKQCTLFEPMYFIDWNPEGVLEDLIVLRHVHTRQLVGTTHPNDSSHPNYGLLSLFSSTFESWTFIDRDAVVVLPDIIRIKGDNGNHLKAFAEGYLDYNSKADNSSLFDYEVIPSRNGGIQLKNTQLGKYLVDMNDKTWLDVDDRVLIMLQKVDYTGAYRSSVFVPLKLGDDRIVMRSLTSNKYLKRYTTRSITSFLATVMDYPDDASSMGIEEPVMSRKITDVIYHTAKARRYNEKTEAIATDDVSNKTQSPLTSALNLKTTVTNTTNWSTSVSLKAGVKMTGTLGVPLVSSGSLEASFEFTGTMNWGTTNEVKMEVGSVHTITVAPMTRVKGSLIATRLSYDIPFSYEQRDVLKNGEEKKYTKHDGSFTGNDGYGYRYEVVPLPFDE